jgi:hypothetical protein
MYDCLSHYNSCSLDNSDMAHFRPWIYRGKHACFGAIYTHQKFVGIFLGHPVFRIRCPALLQDFAIVVTFGTSLNYARFEFSFRRIHSNHVKND